MNNVMVFGCFDIIHKGHLYFFNQAKKHGNYLTVVVAKDCNAKKEKGKYPHNNETKRLKNIKKLKIINQALLGEKENRLNIIRKIHPDIICLGHDQKIDENRLIMMLGKFNLHPKIIRIKAYRRNIYSTTKIKVNFMEKTYKNLLDGTRKFFKKNKINNCVIGLSGGIDSSLCAKILCEALHPKNVTGIIMPEQEITLKSNVEDAKNLCEQLKMNYHIIELSPFLKAFKNIPWPQKGLAKANTKSRIRSVILYNFAGSNKALVCGTSNKTEILLGYFTKFGDGAVDFELIGSLYKTEVKMLSIHLNLPHAIIDKVPTAELYRGQTDEGEIGGSYSEIDEILKDIFQRRISKPKLFQRHNKKLVEKIHHLIESNKHKLILPPIIK